MDHKHKTRGIVLNYIKYRDTSIITKIYTEQFGLQTYVVNGVRSKKSKGKIAYFQPLNLLDIVVYKNPKKDIQRISEIKFDCHFNTIPFEIKKTTITMFLSEILVKTLKEEQEDEQLFSFLHDAIQLLDAPDTHHKSFHISFLIQLGKYLGISPHSYQGFLDEKLIPHYEEALHIEHLFSGIKTVEVKLNRKQSNELLDELLKFYAHQYPGLAHLRSLEILREVMA